MPDGCIDVPCDGCIDMPWDGCIDVPEDGCIDMPWEGSIDMPWDGSIALGDMAGDSVPPQAVRLRAATAARARGVRILFML